MKVLFNSAFASLFGVATAYISWSFTPEAVLFSSIIFFSYFYIEKRLTLFFIIISYHLFASYGLLTGMINFYDLDYTLAILLWIAAPLLSSIPWIVFWSKNKTTRLYLFPIALFVVIAPPFGFFTWVNPILSAAVIFPSMGFLGIFLYLFLLYVIVLSIKYFTGIKQLSIPLISLSMVVLFFAQSNVINKNDLKVINTKYTFKNNTVIDEYLRQKNLLKVVNKTQDNTILLPEHILGTFTKSSMIVWDQLKKNKKIYAGASVPVRSSNKYHNALLELTKNSHKVIYKQRVPVPFEMWKPFTKDGATAAIFSSGPTIINHKKVGVFICYEQYLTYTYLDTLLEDPDYIIGISNLWWLTSSTLINIQKNTLYLWAKLFNIPHYYSVNQ